MADILLHYSNLSVVAGTETILKVADLEVYRGEVLTILGPNGAGKSTFLLATAHLKNIASGSVSFVDNPSLDGLNYRRRIATVFQTPLLLDDTVFNNVSAGLVFRGIPSVEIRKRVNQWLERLNILQLAKRRAATLSGGEAQRVSLARAFCLQTDIILMDEPFSALDVLTRQTLMNDLRSILADTQQTCLYVTHDMEEALVLADRVAIFFKGEMHQIGSPAEVFGKPSTPEVAAFVGVETIIPGQVILNYEGINRVRVNGDEIDALGAFPIGTAVYVCMRPEDITLIQPDQILPGTSARNKMVCRIHKVQSYGPLARVQLTTEVGSEITISALITRSSAEEMNLVVGKQIVASFKASAVHLIPHGVR